MKWAVFGMLSLGLGIGLLTAMLHSKGWARWFVVTARVLAIIVTAGEVVLWFLG